ncbi:hypothetical protein [Rhizobium sp. WSM1325]|uniref:hypothetical protein n=1 Tax=Rhizobium sp. WSM1325 TaxID=3444086 RepID=UPI000FEE2738|nr:hypothetical protein [Rhizobium leguminosarum]RWY80852.1 hypothetical protein EHI48_05420 [Rhizobium leguminosarum]
MTRKKTERFEFDRKRFWIAARRLAAFCEEPPPRTSEDNEAVIEIIAEYAPRVREGIPDAVVTPVQLSRMSLKLGLKAKRSLH